MRPARFAALVALSAVLPATAVTQLLYYHGDDINVLNPVWSVRSGADHLAVGRAAIADRGLSASVLVNPALQTVRGWRAEAAVAWGPTADGLFSYTHQLSAVVPVRLSVSLPLGPLSFTIGATRSHDERSESPDIPLTTEADPEGTGQTVRVTTISVVHTFFASSSAEVTPGLALGLTLAIDDIDDRTSLWTTWYRSRGTTARIVGGAWYAVSELATVGAAVRYAAPATLAARTNVVLRVGGARMPPDLRRVARWPAEVEMGTSIRWLPNVRFLASLQYTGWASAFRSVTDRWDFRLGLEAEVAGLLLRAGTFTQGMPVGSVSAYYDQQFLTVGIGGRWTETIRCSAAYATSAPFTRSNISTIIGPTGESFHRSELVAGVEIDW